MPHKKSNQKTRYWLVIVVAGLVFLAAALQAHTKVMANWEVNLFYQVYNWPLNLKPLMLAITETGSTWMVVILTAGLYYFKKTKIALQVLLTGLATFGLVELAKVVVSRPRPFVLLSGVQARERFVTDMGFPSGHTAVTVAIILVLVRYVPKKYRGLFMAWLCLVAVSRLYLGVHAPLDIIGGLALGIGVAEGLWLVWPKVGKPLRLGK